MRCYFQVNSQRQKTSEDTAAMCCFLIFNNSLKKKMKEEHQQTIEEKDNQIQAIQYENVECRHKEMCIRPSYKNVETPSSVLKHVM